MRLAADAMFRRLTDDARLFGPNPCDIVSLGAEESDVVNMAALGACNLGGSEPTRNALVDSGAARSS